MVCTFSKWFGVLHAIVMLCANKQRMSVWVEDSCRNGQHKDMLKCKGGGVCCSCFVWCVCVYVCVGVCVIVMWEGGLIDECRQQMETLTHKSTDMTDSNTKSKNAVEQSSLEHH